MKYRVSILIAGLISVIFINASGYGEEDSIIDKSKFNNTRRPPSVFNHDFHMMELEIEECSECHHLYEDGVLVEDESSEGESCSECHPMKPSENQKITLMKAYHLNCKGCHKEEKAGPVMCGQCHVK